MADLFVAIADYLRYHNARLRPRPIPRVWPEAVRAVGRCRICDAPIVAGDDGPALAALLAAGRCLGCYRARAA